jgi:hypothetical protein
MQTVINLEMLARRWGVAPNSIRNMEHDGLLHRLPDLPGARYSMAEVVQLESLGPAAKGMTAWERRQKDEEIRNLKEQVQDLQGRLLKAQQVLQGGVV